jgi:hypothetical protein
MVACRGINWSIHLFSYSQMEKCYSRILRIIFLIQCFIYIHMEKIYIHFSHIIKLVPFKLVYHVWLAQVWTHSIIFTFSELNFLIQQCEHIEGSTDFAFQTQFLQFVWISSNKITSKSNIFHTLALKIVK